MTVFYARLQQFFVIVCICFVLVHCSIVCCFAERRRCANVSVIFGVPSAIE